jgi:DNA-damage-inducible protein J
MKTAVIHARIEPGIKRNAEGVLSNLGISPTEAIRIFYRQITLRRGLPFAVAVPNECTAATLKKSRRGEDVQEFESLDAMFERWKA